MKFNRELLVGIIVGAFLSGFLFEINIISRYSALASGGKEVRQGLIKFTNPLLGCNGVDGNEKIKELSISKKELGDLVDDLKYKNNLTSVSVYLRDLNNGPWIGINEKEEFIGSSLLKVPVMISILKLLEQNPDFLNKKIKYEKKIITEEQFFKPVKEIEIGKEYSIKELIEYMVYYSDNNAGAILASILTNEQIKETFASVGLGTPVYSQNFLVNPKIYSGFFRVLFNASYLNREFSELALNLLSQTNFNAGITKKLPKNIVVSHKFGIREINGLKQLHDCGIVYYPNHPYLVCIMTKGNDYEKMADTISEISKFIYEEVSGGLNR